MTPLLELVTGEATPPAPSSSGASSSGGDAAAAGGGDAERPAQREINLGDEVEEAMR